MPIKVKASGPSNAKIMIIGEAPGADEEVEGRPFVGTSGNELTRMLNEAGILRSECYLTNVCKYRPPENKIEVFFLDEDCTKPNELILEGLAELKKEIEEVKPALIIAFGGLSLWALQQPKIEGAKGYITKWRGSMLRYGDSLLMCTYHPAYILRQWEHRAIAIHDLRRANEAFASGSWPEEKLKIIVRPNFGTVMDVLGELIRKADAADPDFPIRLGSDLETRVRHIACHGISWSASEAISIPTMCVERPNGYFTLEEEVGVWERERSLLTHRNVEIVGQNYLYDAQYFARRKGYVPRLRHDTLFMQHIAWTGLPRGLDFLSSMYCAHHVYWKDEGKEWNPKEHPEEQYWLYNGKDAVKTWEISNVLEKTLKAMPGQWDLYLWQMQLWWKVLNMSMRGLRVDQMKRGKIGVELLNALASRESDINFIAGHELNVRSPLQMRDFFYREMKCTSIRNRKTKKLTVDDEALLELAIREPLMRPLIERIQDARSIGQMIGHVIKAELDPDGRIRSFFSPTAETLRWTSKKSAFRTGTNLQNWTKGDEDKEKEAIKGYPIPNVRKLIIPDYGKEIASIDLTGADAQTVAWESADDDLKRIFRENKIKIHAHNAKAMYPGKAVTGFEQPYYDLIRTGVHLVNYLGQVKTLAGALGCPIYEAKRFRDYWFRLHPGIPEWHERVEQQLMKTRTATNKFGYRRFYFERIADCLPEAVAWIGQSTTACVTNRAFMAVESNEELMHDLNIEFLLQVHDELVFQYPTHLRDQVLKAIKPLIHITIPYEDPLVIPWGLKTSTDSWGDCQKRDWPT